VIIPEGTVVDRKYLILGPLAEGGMGSVYRARHVLTEQSVALKVLTVGPDNVAQARRFKLEVSVAAKVKHPAIVQMYDAGIELETGRFYLAMEFLEGRSLRDAMDSGESADTTIRWLLDAISAIAAAHALDVIHRDLKPDNLFVEHTDDGDRLRVLDFGIARDLSGPSATTTGVAVGTALYMSPEQATASKDIGPAVDVWAFGAILYEILTNRCPFSGASAHAVVVNAVTSPHAPISELRPELDEGWSALVDSCLAKAPEARPSTDELLAAVTTLLDAGGTLASPIPLVRERIEGATTPWDRGEPADEDRAARISEDELAATVAAPSIAEPVTPVPERSPARLWALAAAVGLVVAGGAVWKLSDAAPSATELEPTPVIETPAQTEDPPPEPVPVSPVSPVPTVVEPAPTAPIPSPPAPVPARQTERVRPSPARRADPAPREDRGAAAVGEPSTPETPPEPAEPSVAEATPPAATAAPEPDAPARPAPTEPAAPDEGGGVLQGDDAFDRQARRRRH